MHCGPTGACRWKRCTSSLVSGLDEAPPRRSVVTLFPTCPDLNLKRLKISSTLHAESPSNHLHPLPLEHLELSDQHFPSFIIRPLLLAAHSLTSLSLDFDSKSVIGKSDGDAWLQIAPQLRRLHLISSREPSWVSAFRSAEDGCDGFLDYFLPACTSLSSLNLDLKYFNTLRPRLQLLNCTLRLLTTEFSLNYYEPISNGWVEEALELQSMAGLQRWRMKIWPYRGDDGEREEMLKQWTEICEQRGIEARGFERYFTGELFPTSLG